MRNSNMPLYRKEVLTMRKYLVGALIGVGITVVILKLKSENNDIDVIDISRDVVNENNDIKTVEF